MASLLSLNRLQLEALKREQMKVIAEHEKNSDYSSNTRQHTNTLKRLKLRLEEIENALLRF